jgi:hypothetical protein
MILTNGEYIRTWSTSRINQAFNHRPINPQKISIIQKGNPSAIRANTHLKCHRYITPLWGFEPPCIMAGWSRKGSWKVWDINRRSYISLRTVLIFMERTGQTEKNLSQHNICSGPIWNRVRLPSDKTTEVNWSVITLNRIALRLERCRSTVSVFILAESP